MTAISGVQVKKNAKGKTAHIAIDLRKHQEMIPILEEKGLMPKTELQKEAEDCLSVDEVFDDLAKTIDDFYAKRGR